MPDKMRAEIHLHNAKPTVWQSDSVIGIWFNEGNVEVTAFLSDPQVAIEAGRKLLEAGKRYAAIQEAKKAPVNIEE